MRGVLYFYFAALALLFVGIISVAHNPEYLYLVTFRSEDEAVQKKMVDVPSLAEETGKDNSDCPFGFGFVKDLIKFTKPNGVNDVTKLHALLLPFSGAIRQGTLCADSMDAVEGDTVGISPCHGHGRNQEWTFTEKKQIKNKGRDTLCLSWGKPTFGKRRIIVFQTCNSTSIKQKWQYDSARKQIMPTINPRICVSSKESVLVLARCDRSSKYQKWSVIMTELLNLELQSVT